MTIHAYQQNKINTVCTAEFIAQLLEKAAFHMAQALKAINEDKFEKRNHHSLMAQDILLGLEKYAFQLNVQPAAALEALTAYYKDTTTLIVRMNIKNDEIAAASLQKSLLIMANMWRQLKQDKAKASLVSEDPNRFRAHA